MAGSSWQKCKFLESAENLKPLVKMRFGRETNSTLAREISACLQQGRLFYEAAESSSLEIRPLQQFYGMVGFAKALIIAQSLMSLSTLKPSHGIRDVSARNSRIEDLKVHIDREGTFQTFNDVVAPLTRLCYIDNATNNRTVNLPSTESSKLYGAELSLREILSRVPEVSSLYKMTFGDASDSETILVEQSLHQDEEFRIRIDNNEIFDNSESLRSIVNRLRAKYPFFQQWRLTSAQPGWGKSIIRFRNMGKDAIDEFSEPYMSFSDGSYEERPVPGDANKFFAIETGLHPLAGGFSSAISAVSATNGLHISEFSYHYLALFLLSSLVRYQPQIWTHAISRSTFQETPPDDKALSLIEEFLSLNSSIFPSVVAAILNPHEDEWFK
jgi:hypothetical protein